MSPTQQSDALDQSGLSLAEQVVRLQALLDKQDGGHCVACQKQVIKFGVELEDWKAAETAGQEMVAEAQGDRSMALAHYEFASVLMTEGMVRKKDEYLARAHEEICRALAAFANFPDAIFIDGQLLARLQQDQAANEADPSENMPEAHGAFTAALIETLQVTVSSR